MPTYKSDLDFLLSSLTTAVLTAHLALQQRLVHLVTNDADPLQSLMTRLVPLPTRPAVNEFGCLSSSSVAHPSAYEYIFILLSVTEAISSITTAPPPRIENDI